MCKVFMIAGIKPENVPSAAKLAKQMAKEMSYMEDDGVGYAAITKDCKIYGEKWLYKDDAFIVHNITPPNKIYTQIKQMFGDAVEFDKEPVTGDTYTSFGDRSIDNIKNTVAMILHARKATQGSKTLINVHPFVKAGNGVDEPLSTALIHNGSIYNHEKLTKEMSECDSEVILHEYLANQMYHNPWGIDQLAKTLVGTYTVGVLGSQLVDNVWTPYLDLFKSNRDLIGGYVPELETFVFSTIKHTLETALKACDMTLEKDFKFKDGFLHRINAITGEAAEESINFTTSSQHMNSWNTQHEHSRARAQYPYGPPAKKDDIGETTYDIKGAKKHFERRHPAFFVAPYLEADITDDEKAFFDTLKKDETTDKMALRLVEAALGKGA